VLGELQAMLFNIPRFKGSIKHHNNIMNPNEKNAGRAFTTGTEEFDTRGNKLSILQKTWRI